MLQKDSFGKSPRGPVKYDLAQYGKYSCRSSSRPCKAQSIMALGNLWIFLLYFFIPAAHYLVCKAQSAMALREWQSSLLHF